VRWKAVSKEAVAAARSQAVDRADDRNPCADAAARATSDLQGFERRVIDAGSVREGVAAMNMRWPAR